MADKGKDFAGINTGRAYTRIEQAISTKGQQGEVSPQEKEERAEALRTQGRKGCKAIRINMAFTPANHQFIKVMAKISGRTLTEFTNYVIEQYRAEHADIYDEAKALIDRM